MTRVGVALANIAALALLAAVVAYWGWMWFGPAPYHAAPREIPDPVTTLAVSPPFGAGTREEAPMPAAVPSTLGDIRLLGVLAEADGRGQALFRFADGSARLVTAGDELGSGTTLVAVRPDGVTVRDAQGERNVLLRAQQPATAPPAAPAARPGTQAVASSCAPPPNFKGNVVRLNAELVQGLMQQPETLRAVAEPGQGGIVVRQDDGFARLLGLRKGDRLSQANGIALRTPEDVIVAVLRPLAASQPVRVSGSRGSEARELLIVNASACR